MYSRLWGTSGELFVPGGLLDDWSWAGFNGSDATPLPTPPVTADLKRDFGAVGDGVADDTNALERAFQTLPSTSVLFIPAGTYMVTRNLTRTKQIVVRGAGRDDTTLYYPYSFKVGRGGQVGGWGRCMSHWGGRCKSQS